MDASIGSSSLVLPRWLDRLAMELVEILRSRNGYPTSLASLPSLHYQRYGTFLTSACSLTDILASLQKRIRTIGRDENPYVVLVDAPKSFTEQCEIVREWSCKIFISFRKDSTFEDKDVADYFNKFGPVKEVTIRVRQSRTFGFVTFHETDSVCRVLAEKNQHIVGEAAVTVKPYMENPELTDKKQADKSQYNAEFPNSGVASSRTDHDSTYEVLNLPEDPFGMNG